MDWRAKNSIYHSLHLESLFHLVLVNTGPSVSAVMMFDQFVIVSTISMCEVGWDLYQIILLKYGQDLYQPKVYHSL